MARCDWLVALTRFLLPKEENQDRLLYPGHTAESSTTEIGAEALWADDRSKRKAQTRPTCSQHPMPQTLRLNSWMTLTQSHKYSHCWHRGARILLSFLFVFTELLYVKHILRSWCSMDVTQSHWQPKLYHTVISASHPTLPSQFPDLEARDDNICFAVHSA